MAIRQANRPLVPPSIGLTTAGRNSRQRVRSLVPLLRFELRLSFLQRPCRFMYPCTRAAPYAAQGSHSQHARNQEQQKNRAMFAHCRQPEVSTLANMMQTSVQHRTPAVRVGPPRLAVSERDKTTVRSCCGDNHLASGTAGSRLMLNASCPQ